MEVEWFRRSIFSLASCPVFLPEDVAPSAAGRGQALESTDIWHGKNALARTYGESGNKWAQKNVTRFLLRYALFGNTLRVIFLLAREPP
jgi:hypothetical protein